MQLLKGIGLDFASRDTLSHTSLDFPNNDHLTRRRGRILDSVACLCKMVPSVGKVPRAISRINFSAMVDDGCRTWQH